MPSVLRLEGFDFRIYPNDHLPEHIHVVKAGGEIVINLGNELSSPAVRDIFSMRPNDVKRVLKIADEKQSFLLERWREING